MINPAAQEGQLGAQRSQACNPLYSFGTLRPFFCVNFTLLHLGGFTPQNMLSTGQTPQNLVGSSNLLPKSIEAFIDPSRSYSSLMCPVALEKPFAHRIFDHIFNLEWSSQRITCFKLEISMIDLPKLSTGHTPHASLSSVREQGSVHKQEFGAG